MDLDFCRRVFFKVILIVVCYHGVTCQQCGSKKEVSYARIPDVKTLLRLDELDKFVSKLITYYQETFQIHGSLI